ncbi:MAG: DUF4199 domain-containing protein [Rudaea sp.]|uniref:DUF4199 domain-containing protein n=1 Tax=unclassified Rudaea TaxID=2627037 RepID=UPI0010F5C65A|nr:MULTISPECIES: DUF4199 domain-containing protein [unclassified Rudaea]MBN8884325.1 DUF4199 domain-containing protein [Rudaea sp.]MBR0346363.1 DUF4199 domain-containing protein [Rudaea sp.]
MFRIILRYGVLAGLIVGVPMLVLTVTLDHHMPVAWGMVIGYTTMLIAFSLVFIAIKRHRDGDLGGVIRFWPAFALGLGITVVASVFYVCAWEALLATTHMDFIGGYAQTLIEQKKASGVSGEALAKFVAEMETLKAQYANPLYRLPMTFTEIFPIGALVSLIAAALLRNRRFLAVQRT